MGSPPVTPSNCSPPTTTFAMQLEDDDGDLQIQPDDVAQLPTSHVVDGKSKSVEAMMPISQLWEEFQTERTIIFDDYFDQIQQKIERGESLFSTVLPPLEDELSVEQDDGESSAPDIEAIFADYGIDLDSMVLSTSLYDVFIN